MLKNRPLIYWVTQGFFFPPIVGGKWKFEDYFPPIFRDPGGEIRFISPPYFETLGGKFSYFPPLWGGNLAAAGGKF